ncbi:hypothetical protein [Streptacidiphilus monticola]|uniref:Uncharacterized protein n=1 Tax=Streptacidiphilus monticola TaxID=2161674 RepID=A0ABW1G3E3_9ACTN
MTEHQHLDPHIDLAFVRHLDGLTYRFVREADDVDGRPSYRRVDLDVWCRHLPDVGWCTVFVDGTRNGWPVHGRDHGPLPPATTWRSWKLGKSYLYEVRLFDDGGADDTAARTQSSGSSSW